LERVAFEKALTELITLDALLATLAMSVAEGLDGSPWTALRS
jgi:hypothetical protein